MSVKEKRCVTFEEPDPNLGSSEPSLVFTELNINDNFRSSLTTIYKNDSRSRSRGRSKSWSKFRARRTKSHDVLPLRDPCYGGWGPSDGFNEDPYEPHMVRTSSRSSVRNLVKLFETRSMNEGRRSQIVLLDERRLDIIIQPKLYVSELLDLVASHVSLKEKRYFGLGFLDDTNQLNWLQGEKRVLDHEFPKKSGLLVLHFAIKFYVDSIGLLRDTQTVELFYLNSRQLVFKGHLQCDADTVFELAALVLQATTGDFYSEEKAREELKKLPVIPTRTLREHPSLAYCEKKIIFHYERLSGTSRGLAIVNYMTIVERLDTYGIHYYDVKDKKDIPWSLGVSPRGIAVYDKSDKSTPRKLFNWRNLENLYYRDKRFSIEVNSPRRASLNCRTFGSSHVTTHSWMGSSQQLIKCVWSMAVWQHQYYLDRKQGLGQLPVARSMSEIAANLCRSSSSLGSDLSHSSSSHSLLSLSNSRYDLTVEQSDSLRAERDMYQALKARKDALRDSLRKKTEELKRLCLQEAELTGQLPSDIPLSPGEQPPTFRRRVGTAFCLSPKNFDDTDQLSNELSKLELEVELQEKITAAAYRLATDKTVTKYVRKQRKQSYIRAQGKLKDMHKKLDDMRVAVNKCSVRKPSLSRRPSDTTYHAADPCSKRDLDMTDVIIVHDHSSSRRDDSCGNSINSGDFSVGSDMIGSKCASSGYCSTNASSVGSTSRWLASDDISSFCGSISLSTVKSGKDIASVDVHSVDIDDSLSSSAHTSTLSEDECFTLTRTGKKKHFIITRGHDSSRVQELSDDWDISKLSTSSKSDSRTKSNLASSESDDLDSTLDDSFMGSSSLYGFEDDLKDEEEKVCTKVERRQQTFIASRRLMKNINSEIKHAGFEKGWQAFQHILMGEDFVNKSENCVNKNGDCVNKSEDIDNKTEDFVHEREDFVKKSEGFHEDQINTSQQQDITQSETSSKALTDKDLELQKKIKELIDTEDDHQPFVRSRSFDYCHDSRVSRPNVNINKSKDDSRISRLKNITSNINKTKDGMGVSAPRNVTNKSKDVLKPVKTQPKAKDSGTHLKNPFTFLTRRHKPQQLKNFDGDTKTSVPHGVSQTSHGVAQTSTSHGVSQTSSSHGVAQTFTSHGVSQTSSSHGVAQPAVSQGVPQASVAQGCARPAAAPHSNVGTKKTSSAQPGVSGTQSEDSKRNKHPVKDFNKLGVAAYGNDLKHAYSTTVKTSSRSNASNGHCSRSTSESSVINSKRSLASDSRLDSKVGHGKETSSLQNRDPATASSSQQRHDSASASIFKDSSSSKDISSKSSSHHLCRQHSRGLSSNTRLYSVTNRGTETTV